MHKEILSEEQANLVPLVKSFADRFRLVGGTAIALQIGHRRSIDFDLFSEQDFDNGVVAGQATQFAKIHSVKTDLAGQFTFFINGVQFTFFRYRFSLQYPVLFESSIYMPDLLTLAAMKLHALGRRAKWKDYVDLYFIFKDHCTVAEAIIRAKELFGGEVNERDLRTQIGYFYDMNYSEQVEFMPGFEVPSRTIKEFLKEASLK